MTMDCIKTGCHIYLEEYGEFAYGDAFIAGNLYLFRLCETSMHPINGNKNIHFTVHRSAHWFDRDETSMKHQSTLISFIAHTSNLGYSGAPHGR